MNASVPNTTMPAGKAVYVVSNRFARFADNESVLTYETALTHITSLIRICNCVMLGQGLNPNEVQHIKQLVLRADKQPQVRVVEWVSQKAPKDLVHKLNERNVLITAPVRKSAQLFNAQLVVDDDCAEMSDHQTGEHIQGTVLVEAARQMFMACTLMYSMAPEFRNQTGPIKFTLSQMQVVFHSFIFPVTTRIELEYGAVDAQGAGASGSCQVRYYQFEQLCCEVFCAANAFPEKTLGFLETRSANKMRRKLSEIPVEAFAINPSEPTRSHLTAQSV